MIPLNNIIVTWNASLTSLLALILFYLGHIIIIQLEALLLLIVVNQVPFSKFMQKIVVAARTVFVKGDYQSIFLLIVVYRIDAVELFKLLDFFTLTF